METDHPIRLLLPRPVRGLPADLGATIVVTILVNVVIFAPVIRDTPLRVPLGLLFVLFVPGYVFVAVLFPEEGASPPVADGRSAESDRAAEQSDPPAEQSDPPADHETDWETPFRSGIDGIERLALSFGLSVVLVPLIGLALNFTPWGIRLIPMMIALTTFILVATAVAAVRRWNLPEDERFRVPYRAWIATGRSKILEPETRADGVMNVLLALSILLAVGSVGYAVAAPPQGEDFSAIYILTEEDDGELVADGYPTEFEPGESGELVVGVDNHEQRTTEYTIVVAEQLLESDGNETTVVEQRELDRFSTQLEHDETWTHAHSIQPTLTGDDVRIVWLLYLDGDVPDEPSTENAAYHVHLWAEVEETET